MQRYFVLKVDGIIAGQDAHHIKNVMRMKKGDEIIVCSKQECYKVQIIDLSSEIKYQTIELLPKPKDFNVTLIQGLPKKGKTEFVTKYATVFGVSKIIFCGMVRSVIKLENSEFKVSRLSQIAKEASELAHRFEVPEIVMLNKITQIDFSAFDEIIVADENETQILLSEIKPQKNNKYAIIIGPEGGISDDERNFFQGLNAKFISLGHYILPTEAASLSILSYFMQENTEIF